MNDDTTTEKHFLATRIRNLEESTFRLLELMTLNAPSIIIEHEFALHAKTLEKAADAYAAGHRLQGCRHKPVETDAPVPRHGVKGFSYVEQECLACGWRRVVEKFTVTQEEMVADALEEGEDDGPGIEGDYESIHAGLPWSPPAPAGKPG